MTAKGPNFEAMREDLMMSVRALERRRRVTMRAGIAGGAVLAAAAATGAAWVVQAPRVEIANTVYCYEEASINSRHGQVTPAEAAPSAGPNGEQAQLAPGPRDRGAHAIEQCAAAWRVGVFNPEASADVTYPVPDLFVCERHDGVLAVFPQPADEAVTCSHIGLRPVR